ncbi:methyl-accepting chemotaxis protein [Vibrio europaeus]|uniref:Methyl-accepting chemotaxis protein n=1 Tax=Vibrio europaeus TaxID=300876 RepID=A0AAE7B1K0_9VIBR|nr:methyl-accepting chemotaxis protein [Vibrio europaeus]MDC5804830.1 methyl-accepting chemotaxis protein [Vibrio europaeus]MDC5811864.1 methyl-accepting chemotaxis protein [Vibrio europaeus]MDC5827095.1 methyl-accepting chemotaxis protein [Vibrio europaeus]MDC5832461.1 methyl-accepting chemotaxis protein [Vibrio europaeus]MDC5835416.1 methyl-accepting chemotaxis protein [Vibrio europaeus]
MLNLTIANKIRLGFAICLLFFLVAILYSYKGMVKAAYNFEHYGELSTETALAGEIQANFLKVRLSALQYANTLSQQQLSIYESRLAKLRKMVSDDLKATTDPLRKKHLETVFKEVNLFDESFQIVKQSTQAVEHKVYVEMVELEKKAIYDLEQMIEAAHDASNADIEYYSSLIMEKFLLANIAVLNYLHNEKAEVAAEVRNYFGSELPALEDKFRNYITSSRDTELLNEFLEQRIAYAKGFEEVVKLRETQHIAEKEMLALGLDISKELELIKLESVEEQHVLSNDLLEAKNDTIEIIISLAILAFIVGIVTALAITRSIRIGIDKVKQISSQLAEGDLSNDVEIKGKDEIAELLKNMRTTILSLRDIVGKVNDSCIKVGQMSEELSAITHTTNQSSNQLSHEMEQISSSIQQLSTSTTEISQSASDAASFTQSATTNVNNSLNEVESTLEAIENAEKAMKVGSTQVGELYDESMNIGSILEVIQGVAEQTNLLALNAAIEAARAGDQGRGFAVVADEVRSLAKRTQEATGQIDSMIHSLQSGADSARQSIDSSHDTVTKAALQAKSASENISAIHSTIDELGDTNTQIAAAVEEQCMVTTTVSENITETYNITRENSETVKHVADSAHELAEVAQYLDLQMKRFRIA